LAHARRFPARSQKRTTEWGAGPNAADLSISSDTGQLWTNASTVVQRTTIVRIRGYCEFLLTTGDAAGAGFFGAVGLMLVSDEAFAAGVTGVPSPLNLEADWIWHSFFSVRVATATVADGVNAGGVYQRLEIDSKAMRIQSTNKTLVGVIDQAESTNAVMEFHSNTRVLDKLS